MLPETRIMLVMNKKKKLNEYFSDVKLTNEIKIEFRQFHMFNIQE